MAKERARAPQKEGSGSHSLVGRDSGGRPGRPSVSGHLHLGMSWRTCDQDQTRRPRKPCFQRVDACFSPTPHALSLRGHTADFLTTSLGL